jgi:hypothetical protein
MMVHISTMHVAHLHQHGAFFVFSMLVSSKDFVEIRSVSQPRKAPRERPHGIFQLTESVIVGNNTLPAEVSVPQASMMKGSDVVFRRLIALS